MIDGVLMVFPCGYNVHRLANYIFWDGGLPHRGGQSLSKSIDLRLGVGRERSEADDLS